MLLWLCLFFSKNLLIYKIKLSRKISLFWEDKPKIIFVIILFSLLESSSSLIILGIKLNISFSLWYIEQLYKDNNGNIRNVISKYNSGKDSDYPKLPVITKNYLKKFDYYFAMNFPSIYNFNKEK